MSTKKMQIIGLKGKSAYQYAQDGGYTGTEAEFKEKMAKELDAVYDYNDLNEKILATAIKPEASGEFIHIEDSAALHIMDFGMEGKTEQKTTEGKNLWSFESSYESTGQGFLVPVGTVFNISAGTYTLSFNASASGMSFDMSFYDANDVAIASCSNVITSGKNTNSFTLSADGVKVQLYMTGATTLSDIQIEAGSVATPYEPHTNGPSPNPDYEQPITNAGVLNPTTGRYEIGCKVVTGNLLPSSSEEWDIGNMLYWGAMIGTEVGYAACSYTGYVELEVQPNTNVCFRNDMTDKYWVSRIVEVDNDRLGLSNHAMYQNSTLNYKDYSFKTLPNTKKILIQVRLVDDTQTFTEADLQEMKIAFGYGDSVSYEPHASQQLTLTSPVPLTKWDKLVKRDGVYGWSVNHIHNPELTYDSFMYGATLYGEKDGVYVYMGSVADKAIGWQTSKCTTFKNMDSAYNKYELWTYSDQPSMKTIYFCTDCPTVEEWKAYLDENPLDIWYQTTEEQSFYPLPDSEQELLKSLETYYQVTNITNDQNCPMSIQYIADTQTYIDNLANGLTNAVVSLGGEV